MVQRFHILTVDVEDWPQSTLNHNLPISYRVVANTHALLGLLNETNMRATFFILGKVAEAHPRLAAEIAAQGHEVATHGYSHESIQTMPVANFRAELHRSVEVLRQQSGQPVLGHRAADFAISSRFLHLLELLSEEGLAYDSSIYPIRHPRYGVPKVYEADVEGSPSATALTTLRDGVELDRMDGLTVSLPDGSWFNLRASNTEPLLRLNVEAADDDAVAALRDEVLAIVRS